MPAFILNPGAIRETLVQTSCSFNHQAPISRGSLSTDHVFSMRNQSGQESEAWIIV